ncbi:hypothetical protein GW17_00041030 [Ensete ventricosum]|nr:hypothetical protein GW17_00041030 [Ensete ventricosum]
MDDKLLKLMKDLESARVELPRRAIDDYKDSADFKEGLKRMGRVTYKYGYRVALARFALCTRTRRSRKILSLSGPRVIRSFSDDGHYSVGSFPVWRQLSMGSGWVTDLGFSQYQVTRLDKPRMYFTVV